MFGGAVAFNQDLSQWNVTNIDNMKQMFFGATTFNQSLCSWGQQRLKESLKVSRMFFETGCPNQKAPNLTAVPKGPFCYVC